MPNPAKTAANIKELLRVCAYYEVDIHEFNTNSFRLSKGNFYDIDYFPGKNKYFLHRARNTHYQNAWRVPHTSIHAFIKNEFEERLHNNNQIKELDFTWWQPQKPRLIKGGTAYKLLQ